MEIRCNHLLPERGEDPPAGRKTHKSGAWQRPAKTKRHPDPKAKIFERKTNQ